MRYTIHLTFKCNLKCEYCYIIKSDNTLTLETAKKIIDFMFKYTPSDEKIEILFTGGEPLIEFDLLKQIILLIKSHELFNGRNIKFSLITNGTIFTKEIKQFLIDNKFSFCISCDGPQDVHDIMRHFQSKEKSFYLVERNLKEALKIFPDLSVQAVYHPATLNKLHHVVEYFSTLGIRNINLNPDFSARWTKKDADLLPLIYNEIAKWYLNYSQKNNLLYVNLISKKMEVIQRGGYILIDKCQPGIKSMAFSPSGDIYPCERFITDSLSREYRIGNVYNGIRNEKINLKRTPDFNLQEKCIFCDVKDFCMNWCYCSNYFTSGFHDKTGPFLCASEKTAINTAFHVYKALNPNNEAFTQKFI